MKHSDVACKQKYTSRNYVLFVASTDVCNCLIPDNQVTAMFFFVAFIYAFAVFGPLLGFALGALMLQYYVDLLSFDSVLLRLNSSNPRWVGAWWAGFIFIGGLLFLVSLPFFGFPRLLVRELRELVREDPSRLDAMIVEHSGGHCRRSSGAMSSTQSTSSAYGKSIRGNLVQGFLVAALLGLYMA
jgi:Organic Anion Transporter Polypeptide (OATP) family